MSAEVDAVMTFRGDCITVFKGQSEAIVYGSGSDWMVQHSKVTNHCDNWRKWFSCRLSAEHEAKRIASEPYKGPIR